MISHERDYPTFVKKVRKQLALSHEDLTQELGVCYTTMWKNGQYPEEIKHRSHRPD